VSADRSRPSSRMLTDIYARLPFIRRLKLPLCFCIKISLASLHHLLLAIVHHQSSSSHKVPNSICTSSLWLDSSTPVYLILLIVFYSLPCTCDRTKA
jgi:hypothetical protein